MDTKAKYTPPTGQEQPATDADVMAGFFESVMQAAADSLQKLTGKRMSRGGSAALAMAVEAGFPPQMTYTVKDAAAFTGIDRQTLYRERDAGRIAFIVPKGSERGARISVAEIDRWMEENA